MNSRNKQKPRRNGRNDRDRRADKPEPNRKETISKPNDPAWYIKEGQLAKDVASFSFNNALGARVRIQEDNAGGDITLGYRVLNVPGIMTLRSGPAVTPSMGTDSAINLACKNLYSFVRHQNSGHANYDSPDLMLYILAMDSVYSLCAFMQRVLGCVTVYSQVNRYIGDNLLIAMGVDPTDARQNIANFRAGLNMFITKFSAFSTPMTMSLYKRHMWMYSGIYLDEDVAKAQMYMYVPSFVWMYDQINSLGTLRPYFICDVKDGNYYKPRALDSNNLLTTNQLLVMANALLTPLIESEDINIMSGDILKAYGRENTWRMDLVAEGYSVVPVFSEEVLDQIHNTIFTGSDPTNVVDLTAAVVHSPDRLGVSQIASIGGNYLSYQPQFGRGAHLSITHLLDMAENQPDPERVLVATRNMLHGVSSQNTASNFAITTVDSCGSDIVLSAAIHYIDGTTGTQKLYSYGTFSSSSPTSEMYSKFHKAPIFYAVNDSNVLQQVLGELGNFTLLNSDDLKKVHESALLSMLGVPT